MDFILDGIRQFTWQQGLMMIIGAVLIYLAIKKELEPSLLLPMGFGAILVNIPLSGAITQSLQGIGDVTGIVEWLFHIGIEASEAMPLLLFIGIGAMIDFGPLLSNPKLLLFGGAAQFGIFMTITFAVLLGFDIRDAAAAGIIGAADGPTSILVSQVLKSKYIGAIAVAAYSYMALVPIIQPMAIKLVTTKKERAIPMPYNPKSVSKTTRILFPIIVTVIAGQERLPSNLVVGGGISSINHDLDLRVVIDLLVGHLADAKELGPAGAPLGDDVRAAHHVQDVKGMDHGIQVCAADGSRADETHFDGDNCHGYFLLILLAGPGPAHRIVT